MRKDAFKFINSKHAIVLAGTGVTALVFSLFLFGIAGAAESFDFIMQVSSNITLTRPVSGSVSGSTFVKATLRSGVAESVSFSSSGLPDGASASFGPSLCIPNPNCSVTHTVVISPGIKAGKYRITVTATSATLSKIITYILDVREPANAIPSSSETLPADESVSLTSPTVSPSLAVTLTDFSIAVSSNIALVQPSSGTVSGGNFITATLRSGASQAVVFSQSGFPAGASAAPIPPCNLTCSAENQVTIDSSVVPGKYRIIITGTAGSVVKKTSYVLEVKKSAVAPPVITPPPGTPPPGTPPPPPVGSASLPAVGAFGVDAKLAHDIDIVGNRLYVATTRGIAIFDISNPASPVKLGSASHGIAYEGAATACQGIDVEGSYAYLACLKRGLVIFNVVDPAVPVLVAATGELVEKILDVAVKDDVAYVVDWGGRMYLFDVSDPAAPIELKKIGLRAWKSDAEVDSGDQARIDELRSNTSAPTSKLTGVHVDGNNLFVTEWAYGRVYYYTVEDARNPVFAGTHYFPFTFRTIPYGNYMFMLGAYSKFSGLATAPIPRGDELKEYATTHGTDINNPACVGCGYARSKAPRNIDQGGLAVSAGGRHAVIAGGKNPGIVEVFEVSNPEFPISVADAPIGTHDVNTASSVGVGTRGDYIYIAAGKLGLQVYKFAGLSDPISTEGTLFVSPAARFESFGPPGGPFSPASKTYTVTNAGFEPITWSVSASASWFNLSPIGGRLDSGESRGVTVSLNDSAKGLATSTYSEIVSFTNETNGRGNTTREVVLDVRYVSGPMRVRPTAQTVLGSSGPKGGPFDPASFTYEIKNFGNAPMQWKVEKSVGWIDISTSGGTLSAGQAVNLVATFNNAAKGLDAGGYSDNLIFTNLSSNTFLKTDGSTAIGPTTRTVTLNVLGPGQAVFEGFGSQTLGGSGKPIYHVTSLADGGGENGPFIPGTLRDAVSKGDRYIVFDVAGEINLGTYLWVKGANLTIDGLSVPGGITLKNYGIVIRGTKGAHDIIVRGIRVRGTQANDGFQVAYGAFNVVLDHVSAFGADDGNIDITESAHDVTVSWSILAKPKGVEKNMLIKYNPSRISLHHNIFTDAAQRNPNASIDNSSTPATDTTVDMRNNLIWKFGAGTVVHRGAWGNVINNYYSKSTNAITVNTEGVLYTGGNVSADSINVNTIGNAVNPFSAAPVSTQDAATGACLALNSAGVRPLDAVDSGFLSAIVIPGCSVGVGAPSVSVTEPVSGSVVAGTITVAANAFSSVGIAGVQFFVGATPIGSEDTSVPYSVAWDSASILNGEHIVSARARDASGGVAVSPGVPITVDNGATTAGIIKIYRNGAGATRAWIDAMPGQDANPAMYDPVIQGSHTAFVTDKVNFAESAGVCQYLKGASECNVSSFPIAPICASGACAIPVSVVGNQVTKVVVQYTSTTDTTLPSVTLTSPGNGANVSGTINVLADASDNENLIGVQFLLDGSNLGSELTDPPFNFSWNTALVANGSHTLRARARDAAGNISLSAVVNVTVNNVGVAEKGNIRIKRVGSDLTVGTAPATQAWVDGESARAENPTEFINASVGSHLVYATDVSGYAESAGTCSYAVGTSECVVASFTIPPICDGSSCYVTASVLNGKVTKVVFKYLPEVFAKYYEAEDANRNALIMSLGADPAARGGKYISPTSGVKTDSPVAEAILNFNVPKSGTYYLWARMQASDANFDELYIGIDGSWDNVRAVLGAGWKWVRVETSNNSGQFGFNLIDGGSTHTIQAGHGEVAVRLDAFFITDDPAKTP